MIAEMRLCSQCQTEVDEGPIGRRDECRKCGADLQTCHNCRFYDEWVNRQCREPQSEPPREKGRSNYCDFFEFVDRQPGKGGAPAQTPEEAARAAFDALFKK
jgi:hypothetical protein